MHTCFYTWEGCVGPAEPVPDLLTRCELRLTLWSVYVTPSGSHNIRDLHCVCITNWAVFVIHTSQIENKLSLLKNATRHERNDRLYTSLYHSNCPFAQTNTFVACGCQVFTDRTVKTVFSFSLRSQLTHVSDHDGLLEHADRSQLMPDLGGYLEYEHEDWVRFRMVSQLSIFLSACPPLCLSLSFTLSVCLSVCLIC